MDLMKCEYCGKEVEDDEEICEYCRNKLNYINSEDSNYWEKNEMKIALILYLIIGIISILYFIYM